MLLEVDFFDNTRALDQAARRPLMQKLQDFGVRGRLMGWVGDCLDGDALYAPAG